MGGTTAEKENTSVLEKKKVALGFAARLVEQAWGVPFELAGGRMGDLELPNLKISKLQCCMRTLATATHLHPKGLPISRGGRTAANPNQRLVFRVKLTCIMRPPISRAPLRALTTSTSTASTTPPNSQTTTRLFTTTSSRQEATVPPESPRFIPLPELPQSFEHKPTPIKGVLPVPRRIFTKRAHMAHKLQPNFVDDTAPKSRSEKLGQAPKSEKDAWRRLMAESRRTALGSGIKSLWRRKQYRDERDSRRADIHKQRNIAAASAPERPDEVFTRSTITAATLDTRVVRDPDYKMKKQLSQTRTAAIAHAKSEARKDAVQRLYVQASSFILTEEELADRVERVFAKDYFNKISGRKEGIYGTFYNMWDAYGPPPSVAAMTVQAKARRSGSGMASGQDTSEKKTLARQKMIAGELTGGALSVSGTVVDLLEETNGRMQESSRLFEEGVDRLNHDDEGVSDVVDDLIEAAARQNREQPVSSLAAFAEQSAQQAAKQRTDKTE